MPRHTCVSSRPASAEPNNRVRPRDSNAATDSRGENTQLFPPIADNTIVGISDHDNTRSRGGGRDHQSDVEQDDVERTQLDRMRLLGMRKRQVQRKAARQAGAGAKIPETGGTGLEAGLRERMEPQLGADLSNVKVHTGGESATAAEKLGARAFTTGSDVHFGAGEFAPGTKEGDRLLAHELTHAVQAQKSGIQRKPAASDHAGEEHGNGEAGDHRVSQPGEPAEQEADAVADGVAEKLHGDGDKPTASAGKEAAPAIGAKLSGRKIFRAPKAEKKNPADAAVKRLDQSGQDKQQLKDSLKKIGHERGNVIDELTKLQADLPKLGLARPREDEVRMRLRATLRAVQDHLTDSDITGAMRDTANDPVKQSGSGKTFDHLREVNDALASLTRTRSELTRVRAELEKRQIDPKLVADKLNPPLDAIARVVDSVRQALSKVRP
jgi:hypothetical protein